MACTEPTRFAIAPPLIHLDGASFFSLYLPTHVAYFIFAILVSVPGTYILRLALFPGAVFVLYRATTQLDMSNGKPSLDGQNLALMTVIGMMLLRIISWTFQPKTFIRVGKRQDPSNRTTSQILLDATDLCCNFRGIGWDWSNGRVYINPQPEEVANKQDATSKRKEFLRENILSYFVCSAVFEVALFVVLRYPLESTSSGNSAVFLLKRIGYAFLYPTFAYTNLGGAYNLYAIAGVFVFGQDIEEWPPFFNKPWKSTSLTEFWGKRWHQAFRYMFGQTGGRALGSIFGRVGMVLGTFFVSGLLHDGGYWGMHRGRGICCSTTPYFVLNGVGILLEAAVKIIVGRKVGGYLGWIWTLGWLVLCAMLTMPPYCMQDLLRAYETVLVTQPFSLIYTKIFF